MSNPSARHADELRRETVDCMISAGRPITQCCSELGLNPRTVGKRVQDRRRELAGEPDRKAGDRELREARKRIRELEMENAFLKKSAAFFAKEQGVAARYRPMLAERAEHPIRMMARILGVSRSRFCSWLAGGCPEDDWSAEREAVRRVRLKPDRRFGFRFVKCFLPAEFSGLSLYRVRNLMRELGIRGRTPNVRKRTVAPDPKGPTWCGATSPAPSPPISSSATPPACAPARGGSTCPRR
ncbi:IS3 family transposase [uncultured Senegalimassilia sp.]|uniref:IS3 family transposase n=1 Tax=uncultured Senegalimassilia sp. TaxID=1714350 RepID=UPI0025FB7347|nr:IS3 family transposase [uncultured Senegalimassilia sp.]